MYQVNPQDNDKTLANELLTAETKLIMDNWLSKYPIDQRRSALIGSFSLAARFA